MEESNNKVRGLIDQKNFDELSYSEKELVLNFISEEEYDLQREILQKSKQLFETEAQYLAPNLDIKSTLQDALKNKQKPTGILILLQKMFTYQTPSYQVVMGMTALILTLFWWGGSEGSHIIIQEKIVYQTNIDTLRVTDTVTVAIVKYKTIEKIVEVPVQHNTFASDLATHPAMPESIDIENNYEYDQKEMDEQYLKSIGNSSLNKDDLNQFLIVVN
tara:strand:+ start:87 stop:740 length:654 start_codon:yes stop_codon:yes gene_type:complete